MEKLKVYLEIGSKKTIAGALDWPGWCRAGKDADSALQALLGYAPRYASALQKAGIEFDPPGDLSALEVVEQLEGNATTDFGAPDIAPSADLQPVDAKELPHLQSILEASWQALDATAAAAQGKDLRKGPRGGGRELEKILEHVLGAERGYLNRLGLKLKQNGAANLHEELAQSRKAVRETLAAAVRDGLPERGPRGGTIWPLRFFVRRDAWHVFDHAWEIEDRILS